MLQIEADLGADNEGIGDIEPFGVNDVLQIGHDVEPGVNLGPVARLDDRLEILGLFARLSVDAGFVGTEFTVDVADARHVFGTAGEGASKDKASIEEEGDQVTVFRLEDERDEGSEPLV